MKWAIALLLVAAPAVGQPQRDAGWEVRVPDKLDLAAGAAGTLPIAIAVDRGLAISKDGGIVIDLAPDTGVTIRKRRLGRADAADPEADAPRFAVPVHADAAGEHAVRVHVRFWVCGKQVCRPVDVRRTVTVAS
jgi:hypothetical protein